MKRLISSLISVALCSALVPAQQATATARLQGTVLDIAQVPIAKVRITIESPTASFTVTSDVEGKFQIDLPPGGYEVRSDKLPGFAATSRNLTVGANQTAEITIVPAVSSEGVLCILYVTSGPTKKPKKRKRQHR